jgi:hypothetical protein
MAGRLPMGQKELMRGKMMEMVSQKKSTLKEAALVLKVSYRQAKRIYADYTSSCAVFHVKFFFVIFEIFRIFSTKVSEFA